MSCQRRCAGNGCIECGFREEEGTMFSCPSCGSRLCAEHKHLAKGCTAPNPRTKAAEDTDPAA